MEKLILLEGIDILFLYLICFDFLKLDIANILFVPIGQSAFFTLEFMILLSNLFLMIEHLLLQLSLITINREPHLLYLLIHGIDILKMSPLLLGSLLLLLL